MTVCSTSYIHTYHPPNLLHSCCLSQKGCGPHIKWRSLKPSIPAGEEEENAPPIMRPTVTALPHDKGIKMK